MDQDATPGTASPLRLAPGPHLFLDDLLVAESTRVTRRVNPPERVPENPLVPSISAAGGRPGVGCSGNQVSACYDPATQMYKRRPTTCFSVSSSGESPTSGISLHALTRETYHFARAKASPKRVITSGRVAS